MPKFDGFLKIYFSAYTPQNFRMCKKRYFNYETIDKTSYATSCRSSKLAKLQAPTKTYLLIFPCYSQEEEGKLKIHFHELR